MISYIQLNDAVSMSVILTLKVVYYYDIKSSSLLLLLSLSLYGSMDTIDSSSVDGVAERSGGTLPLLLQQHQQQPHDASYNCGR